LATKVAGRAISSCGAWRWAALDEPASLLAPEGIPALDGEPADELEAELEAELDDDAEELDELDDELDEELDDEEGIEGGCEDDREDGEEEDCDDDGIDGLLLELLGGDGLLGELLDALEGLLGEGIDDDDELWLCDWHAATSSPTPITRLLRTPARRRFIFLSLLYCRWRNLYHEVYHKQAEERLNTNTDT